MDGNITSMSLVLVLSPGLCTCALITALKVLDVFCLLRLSCCFPIYCLPLDTVLRIKESLGNRDTPILFCYNQFVEVRVTEQDLQGNHPSLVIYYIL